MEALNSVWCFIGDNASELIALSALFLAIWQGVATRTHNNLTVRPYLVFHTKFQWKEPQLSVMLENVGVGTAVIKKYSVFLDDIEQDTSDKSVFTDIGTKLEIPKRKYGGGKVYAPGDAIPATREEIVFKIVTKEGMDEDFANTVAHKEIERIQIVIEYESLYGTSFKAQLHNT